MNLRLLPLGVVIAMALLVGCSGDDGRSSNAADQQNEATADATGGATAGADAAAAGVENINPEDVIVEQTVAVPDNPDNKVTLAVHSLTVEGEVMDLRLVVTPQFASESNDASLSLFTALGDSLFRPRLVDGANLKEYEPIGGGVPWVSDETEVEAVNGSPMLAWAYFAAPEDSIETIDVRVSDGWPAFTDVPITR
jgi:hypothetical protein